MSKHPNLNIPIRAALLLIVVRLAFHFADINWPQFQMAYLFLVIGVLIPLCIYAIWPRQKGPLPPLFTEVSAAMRVMAVYAIVMIVFIIVFYALIDKSFFIEKQTEILEGALKNDPSANQDELKQRVESFFSLRNFSVLLLLGFMISSAFYALFFSILKRLFFK